MVCSLWGGKRIRQDLATKLQQQQQRMYVCSVQFSSVQSLSRVRLFATP